MGVSSGGSGSGLLTYRFRCRACGTVVEFTPAKGYEDIHTVGQGAAQMHKRVSESAYCSMAGPRALVLMEAVKDDEQTTQRTV